MSRRPFAIFKSGVFRLALLATALFGLCALAMIGFVYFSASQTLRQQSDALLANELSRLEALYELGGINAVGPAVFTNAEVGGEFLYAFGLQSLNDPAGSLTSFPSSMTLDGEPFSFRFSVQREADPASIETRRARAIATSMGRGYVLMIGRDVTEASRFVASVGQASYIASGLVVLLSLLAGTILAERVRARFEALNSVVADVRRGNLSSRARRNHSGDELDALAGNLNTMLDRVDQLMTAQRHAGDAIAHDLRSPLTRLKARLEASLLDVEEGSAADEALQASLRDADELLNTFNAVMRVARLEAGERRAPFEQLDLTTILADLGELYEAVTEDAALEFLVEIEPGLRMQGDRALIAQATANLLDNAVKYCEGGCAIALRGRRNRTGEVEISVTDTGPGIPPADRRKVLERFVRLDDSRTKPGAGLGLSLVNAVVEVHHGRIELSEGAGPPERPGLRAALVFPGGRKAAADPGDTAS